MKSTTLATILPRELEAELLKACRTPAFVLPTLALPLAFYWLFGIQLAPPGSGNAGHLLATFGVFASLGPALFGFGAGIAHERDQGVLALKQLAPVSPFVTLGARLGATLVFTALVLVGLYATAAWAGGVALSRGDWSLLLAVHLLGAIPFCLLGLNVGLRLGGSAAMGVTNLLFMALAVLGGLWFPLQFFPQWLQAVASALPSHHLAQLALMAAGRLDPSGAGLHVLAALAFTALFGTLALRAWRVVAAR